MPYCVRDPSVRFWNHVNKNCDNECWECNLALDKDGYARIKIKDKTIKAHRFSFELHNGRPIENGKQILHSCDNPKCVNPHHLREGTNAENMKDKAIRGRVSGEKHPHAKLTNDQVRDIRQQWAIGGITQQKLANEYHVSQVHISRIILHKLR